MGTNCMRMLYLGVCLFTGAAFAAQVDVTCTGKTSDTSALNMAIANSNTGDQIRIHGSCLINRTIVLSGDRSYLGDSRSGTLIRQANGSSLPAMLASDSWNADTTYTGGPMRIADYSRRQRRVELWNTVIEDLQVENAFGDPIIS